MTIVGYILLKILSRNGRQRRFYYHPTLNFQVSNDAGVRRSVSSCAQWERVYFNDRLDDAEEKFRKILVANRGEIACRVISTAKRMGIKTVAVFSDVDYNSLHRTLADESVCVGPAPVTQSYLSIENIVKAAKDTGVEAVHPGYGFLSENSTFVSALESENIEFIGPSVRCIAGMGDKLQSKRLAMEAGVNTIPGYDGIIKDVEECVVLSQKIGYPVMIKASAGGGGKGMRIARNDAQVREGFALSVQEARSTFGDDRMIVEKYVDNPRHIEIQVLCDKHGNCVYLNERECSIQRRNQKVIEEAPSTFIDEETRKSMGQQAVSLCKRIGYHSAGTVEFLLDDKRNFYFLEMNTRLQVEHPVTEFTTGIDLIHQMFRIAKGHKLRFDQSAVALKGWAIECRVYAEDTYKNFGLPSVGLLHTYREPTHIPNVRCDSGVREGTEISIYYDPMICKLICYGQNRDEAIRTAINALDQYVIRGITHNLPLLRDILTESNFVSGNINTNYLQTVYPNGFTGRKLSAENFFSICCLAATIYAKNNLRNYQLVNVKTIKDAPTNWSVIVEIVDGSQQEKIPCSVVYHHRNDTFKVTTVADKVFSIPNNFDLSDLFIDTRINDQLLTVQLISKSVSGSYSISFEGTVYKVKVLTQRAADLLKLFPAKEKVDISKVLTAPMPGLVKSILCKADEEVSEGQELCVIEAMKMHNSLRAASNAKVKTINIQPGCAVNDDDVLIEFY